MSSSRFLSQAGRSLVLDAFDLPMRLEAFDAAFFVRDEVDGDAEAFFRAEV